MIRNTNYTTQLSQGASAVNETLTLLAIYQKGMDRGALERYVLESGLLSSLTECRVKHIVRDLFYERFLKDNPNVPIWLQTIRSRGILLKDFKQLLMIYCARQHRVYYEYIVDQLNALRQDNCHKLKRETVYEYVRELVVSGQAKWSEGIQKKNTGYIISTMKGFDQISSRYEILPYQASDFTVLYLMHELHFEGLSDMAIWNDSDWKLFGMDKQAFISRILDMNMKGGYIAQYSGELLTISWNYKTMEDFIDGTI